MNRAILLSGGIDSTAIAHWMRPKLAITIDYGQLGAESEINASAAVAGELGIEHDVVRVDCRAVGAGTMLKGEESPTTYSREPEWWPYRNQLLVTLGAARSLLGGCDHLVLGTVKSDCKHQDGTAKFVRLLSELLLMQEGSLVLETPASEFSSSELVAKSGIPMSLLAWSHSCHKSNIACGECGGCQKYREVMASLSRIA
jgi:7-cyano-7-deazaguanine synthase